MNYYERHIGDYLKDTAHLSLLEHGIYGRLLDIYYSRESGLPEEQVSRLVGARSVEEKEALSCVLQEFFVLAEGAWTQSRCNAEIERFRAKQAQAKRAAQASVASRKASVEHPLNARLTDVERTQSPDPVTKKEREPRATRLPAPFVLEPEWREWAKAHRPDLDPDLTAAKFADFWHAKPGKDGRKLDWLATWRNWVREERPPKTSPMDVARQTVPAKPRSDSYLNEVPMTSEQRQAANKARELAVSAFKTTRTAA